MPATSKRGRRTSSRPLSTEGRGLISALVPARMMCPVLRSRKQHGGRKEPSSKCAKRYFARVRRRFCRGGCPLSLFGCRKLSSRYRTCRGHRQTEAIDPKWSSAWPKDASVKAPPPVLGLVVQGRGGPCQRWGVTMNVWWRDLPRPSLRTSLTICMLLAFMPGAAADTGPVIAVTGGQVQGASLEKGGAVFKGIPFAQPPVGALRWREPMPVKPWAGVRDAAVFGAPCTQSLNSSGPPASSPRRTVSTLTSGRRSGPVGRRSR